MLQNFITQDTLLNTEQLHLQLNSFIEFILLTKQISLLVSLEFQMTVQLEIDWFTFL